MTTQNILYFHNVSELSKFLGLKNSKELDNELYLHNQVFILGDNGPQWTIRKRNLIFLKAKVQNSANDDATNNCMSESVNAIYDDQLGVLCLDEWVDNKGQKHVRDIVPVPSNNLSEMNIGDGGRLIQKNTVLDQFLQSYGISTNIQMYYPFNYTPDGQDSYTFLLMEPEKEVGYIAIKIKSN